jgi:RNA polymerase sigma-70 factor (ECF subfamily)
MAENEVPEELRDELRAAWHRYLDLVTPLRGALHRYCLRLTRNVWDAEDLVADTLLRAFGTLGKVHQGIANHRAYLLQTATNAWIDTVRRRATARDAELDGHGETADPERSALVRDAGSALIARLAPRERAALVLKDVFDLSLEEIAGILETTTGAVKAALHRGRERLGDDTEAEPPPRRRMPSVEIVDRFVAAFNAGDLPGLTEMLLDTATQEHVGTTCQFGREALAGKQGWLRGALIGHPEWPEVFQWEGQRLERRVYEGEPIILFFRTRMGYEMCEQVVRLEEEAGRVARIRDYGFCPETTEIVAGAFGIQARGGLYRYPTPEPGKRYGDP